MNLILGDCLEEMAKIPDKSVDMVLTDPPYGTTACKWDTVIPFEPMWKELHRVTKDNGAICLFGSEPFSSALRMSNIKRFKYDWIWHKNRPSGFASAKYRPMINHEIVSVFCKKKHGYFPIREPRDRSEKNKNASGVGVNNNDKYNDVQGIKRVTSNDYGKLRFPTTVKKFNSVNNSKGRVHPTQKPVALLEYLIKTYTLEGETVLDFTMGSGSTGVACKNLNRNFIGIEKEKKYFDIAVKRIGEQPKQLEL